jgi:hypothetical protein
MSKFGAMVDCNALEFAVQELGIVHWLQTAGSKPEVNSAGMWSLNSPDNASTKPRCSFMQLEASASGPHVYACLVLEA